MEREKCTHLYSKRSDFRQDFSHIEELDNKYTNERKTERKSLVERGKCLRFCSVKVHMDVILNFRKSVTNKLKQHKNRFTTSR